MKIVSIVGARPQFIKAATVSRELRKQHKEILVHTGQHYDYAMSGVFFDGLEIPPPDVNLGVGSGSHGAQTGAMLRSVEEVMIQEKPDWVLIYGDTNSTLAGALAASKLHIPVVHVEAGLRSFNRRMPEEVNRVIADHLSALLLCPSSTAIDNLATEGVTEGVHLVGDVMLDVLNWAKERSAPKAPETLSRMGLNRDGYLMATVHRSENTDDPKRLVNILDAFNSDAIPVHLMTQEAIALYMSKLATGGMLAFHISNRSLKLNTVLADLATHSGATSLSFADGEFDPVRGKDPSEWLVMAQHSPALDVLAQNPRWRVLQGHAESDVWTDDFSNILRVFRWY